MDRRERNLPAFYIYFFNPSLIGEILVVCWGEQNAKTHLSMNNDALSYYPHAADPNLSFRIRLNSFASLDPDPTETKNFNNRIR